MKILSIGNSFSVDATRYLHVLAKNQKIGLETVNLYIGGCSLSMHYLNAMEDLPHYELHFNGDGTRFMVSIKQALLSDDFDVVTLQQVSNFSFLPETYEPYLAYLADYVRRYRPHAKLYIHETWAYHPNGKRLGEVGFSTHEAMFDAIKPVYADAAKRIGACGIIPAGHTMYELVQSGISADRIFRDPIHAGLGLGRYALALTWLSYFTGADVRKNTFRDFDVPVSPEEIDLAARAAESALRQQA